MKRLALSIAFFPLLIAVAGADDFALQGQLMQNVIPISQFQRSHQCGSTTSPTDTGCRLEEIQLLATAAQTAKQYQATINPTSDWYPLTNAVIALHAAVTAYHDAVMSTGVVDESTANNYRSALRRFKSAMCTANIACD
jgi:hypothetical protein